MDVKKFSVGVKHQIVHVGPVLDPPKGTVAQEAHLTIAIDVTMARVIVNENVRVHHPLGEVVMTGKNLGAVALLIAIPDQ